MNQASFKVSSGICLALAVGTISLLASQHAAAATNLFWSGNGTTQGGAGTWNTTTARFATAAAGTPAGTYGVTWNNANVDSAEFGGASAGVVNLNGPIVVNTITTDISGFTLGNGNGVSGATNTITFSGANAGVVVNSPTGITTITALISGTLNKQGVGRLELNNTANPTTSKYVMTGGSITTPAISRFGTTAPGSLVQDFLTFNGGGWAINTGNQDTGATRGITIKSGGAFFGSSSTTVNLTISSPIVGSEGGGFTITNVGPFAGQGVGTQAGAIVMLNNTTATPNSWDGNVTIASGTLKLLATNQIPDTALVSLVAGTTFDVNGVTETVKSISGAGGTVALGAGTLTLNNPAGETFGVAGSGGSITGTGSIVKNGSGSITLAQNTSTYTGAANGNVSFTLNAGKVGIAVNPALGTGTVVINNSPTLSAASSAGRAPANNVTLNGNLTLDDSFISNPGTITASGQWTITGASRTIKVDTAANNNYLVTLNGVVAQDAAGRGLTKTGNGVLALNNAANTYSGPTQIDAGSINLDSDGTLGDGTGNVILNGGKLNATADRSGTGSIVLNPVKVQTSSSITSSASAATPIFEFSGALTGVSGQTLTFQDNAAAATQFKPRFSGAFTMDSDISLLTGTGALTASVQLESFNTTGTTQTFNGVISGTGSYNRSASVSGTGGDTVFTAANTYQGGTIVNRGSLTVTNTTGSGTGSGGITVNSQGVLNVGDGTAKGAVSGSITDGGVVNFNRSDDVSYGSPTVSISGNGVVNKKGAGTLSLPNANSHSGGTTQYDGGLKLGDKASLGTGGYTIGDATTSTTLKVSSTANLTGGNAVGNAVTVAKDFTVAAGSSDLELSGTVALGAVNRTITVDSGNSTILSGVISDTGGTGGITKAGSGVLTLKGANTYGTVGVTGTTVSAGKLLVNNTTGSGTGAGNVLVNGGILGGTGKIAGSVTVTSGDLSPGASINALDIGGNLTMTGGAFDYEINSSTATADLNTVSGNLSLSTVALSASELGSGILAMGTKFTLINYGGNWNGGTFTGLPNYSSTLVIGANRFAIKYNDTTGGSNFGGGSYGFGSGQPHYVTITAVPEASTFLVIGLGGVFAFAAVRLGKRMGINVLKA